MASPRGGRPWGKLVGLDSSDPDVLLVNRECTVGRKKGCDLAFPANKLVSGEHCKIVQDESSGLVWLQDMSTNGTVINSAKLVKKQTHMLENGDVIYFVYRKNEPEQNVAYVYHSIKADQPVSSYDTDHSAHSPPSEMLLSVEPVMLSKAPRDLCQEEARPSTSASHLRVQNPNTCGAGACVASGLCGDVLLQLGSVPEQKKDIDSMEPQTKKRKTVAEEQGTAEGAVGTVPPKAALEGKKTDKMEESLTCIICQDLLHDCVSLQPCMHTFCAACYSGWMERSSLCPTCRCVVERIRKNHILNNLVEAYLIQHPEKCRSEDDLKNMDSRNKITQDMMQPRVERSFSDEEGSSDYLYELSDNESDSLDFSPTVLMCRQCPGYRKVSPGLSAPPPPKAAADEESAEPTAEQPSTSSDTSSAPQEYRCPPHGYHLTCSCCLEPMPERPAEQVPAQKCFQCQRPFCHIYWGCQRIGCRGCLAPFADLNLTDKCLDGALNNNYYESEILRNYLTSRGKSWKDLLLEALQDSQQGNYLSGQRISAHTVLCLCCGLRTFKELCYTYRQNISPSDLPAAVTSRPDCYWGRNCRTQVKAHHAMKFNHICEQTRFKN